jgi:hypothetical protein
MKPFIFVMPERRASGLNENSVQQTDDNKHQAFFSRKTGYMARI